MQLSTKLMTVQAPRVIMDDTSFEIMKQSNKAKNIEVRIHNRFRRGYSLLIVLEVLLSLAILIFYAAIDFPVTIVILAIISTLTMISAGILSLMSKSSLDTEKQLLAFRMFSLAAFLNITTTVVAVIMAKIATNNVEEDNILGFKISQEMHDKVNDGAVLVIAIIFVPVQFILDLILMVSSRILYRLLVERDNLLDQARSKLEDTY